MLELALFMAQMMLALFFGISGAHKLFNIGGRGETLKLTLRQDMIPYPQYARWLVATTEFVCGVGLVFWALAALPLLVIACVACLVDAPNRVRDMHPLNIADALDDYLYLCEPWLIVTLILVMLRGLG